MGNKNSESRRARRGCRSVFAFGTLCLCCWFLLGAAARAQDTSRFLDRPVARVEVVIEGAPGGNGDDGSVRRVVEQFVRAGDPLSAEAVHRAIGRLWEAGVASNVTVDVSAAGADPSSPVIVSFHVTRAARIVAIDIEVAGQDDLAALEALRGRLTTLSTGALVTQPLVDRGAEEIVRYYQELGYFEALARSGVRLDETGTRATVVYDVTLGQPARVGEFEIVGATDQQRARLLREVTLRPGTLFTRGALEADVDRVRRALLDAGFLAPEVSEPEVERNPAANTVSIRLRVASGPPVTVSVAGAEGTLNDEELRALLPVYTEGGLDEFQLSEGARRLTEELQRDGYFFARVTFALEGPEEGPRRVVYTVDRGRRYRVADIDIEGTEAVTYAAVADVLRSQEAGLLNRGITSRELLQRDAETIERRMRALGYRRAVVRERRLGVSPDSDELVITFVVEEGPRARVESVEMRGNTVFAREELLAERALEPDDFYTDEEVSLDASSILTKYAEAGYVSAEVAPRLVELDRERVRVIYEVSEGRKAQIAQVEVLGATSTTRGTLNHYFRFKEGETLELDALRRSEQLLFETGAFRQVIITSEPIGVSSDGLLELRRVNVDIEEASPWVMDYGGGFNSDEGPRGLFEISNVNLFGRLNTGALRLRGSRREQLAQITYTNPIPFGYELPLLASINFRRELKGAFDLLRFSALAQVQRRLDDRQSLFFRYNFEQVRIFNAQLSERELERSDRPVRLGRVSGTYLRDTRDNPFDPVHGSFTSADVSMAAEFLGGNEAYLRFLGEHQRYYPLPKFENVSYAGVVKFGLAEPIGDRRRLPITERFFAGGARTLRGFGFEEAGPRDPVTGKPIGGNVLLVINNELRFPLWWRFGGAVFSDTGNVFRRIRDIDFSKITQTVGVGLSVQTPVGPVRMDVGYLLNKPEGARGYAVHFSFGQAF